MTDERRRDSSDAMRDTRDVKQELKPVLPQPARTQPVSLAPEKRQALTGTSARGAISRLVERARRYLSAADLDEQREGSKNSIPRLPDPVPQSVKGVAIGQLIAGVVACALIGGRIAQIIVGALRHPTMVGFREVMVALAIIVFIGVARRFFIPGHAIRAGFRIVRRDARGVHTLRIVTSALTFGSVFAAYGLLTKRSADLVGLTTAAMRLRYEVAIVSALAFNLWSVIVLYRYQRDLAGQLPVSKKRQRELTKKWYQ